MSEISEKFGNRVRNYRIHRNLSQEEFAELCGLHHTYVGQVERGEKNATIVTEVSTNTSVFILVCFAPVNHFIRRPAAANAFI